MSLSEEQVIEALRDCFDPEIPVNVYDLGLVYDIGIDDDKVSVDMTLTAPGCPVAGTLGPEIQMRLLSVEGVNVPVHVILSLVVIVVNEPFSTVISALENPLTASENTRVTVEVSPIFNAVSDIVKEETDGGVISTINVVDPCVAALPATSLTLAVIVYVAPLVNACKSAATIVIVTLLLLTDPV